MFCCDAIFDFVRRNLLNMGPDKSGMPPDHSQTLLDHFLENKSSFVTNLEKRRKVMETSTGRKTDFSEKS